MNRETFDAIGLGRTVYFVTGPGEFPKPGLCAAEGIVTEKKEDRWGLHLMVDCGDGDVRFVESVRFYDEKGIGAYV